MIGYYMVQRELDGDLFVQPINPPSYIICKLSYKHPVFTGKKVIGKTIRPLFIVMASDKKDAIDKYKQHIRIPVHG